MLAAFPTSYSRTAKGWVITSMKVYPAKFQAILNFAAKENYLGKAQTDKTVSFA